MAEQRGQWTIKSKRLDTELQTACRMAAERQGMPVGDWCAETLREGAREVLTGERPPSPPPPARLEDVRDALMGEVERHMAELVARLTPQPVPQPVEAVSQPVSQPAEAVSQGGIPASEREARRLRTMLRRGRR